MFRIVSFHAVSRSFLFSTKRVQPTKLKFYLFSSTLKLKNRAKLGSVPISDLFKNDNIDSTIRMSESVVDDNNSLSKKNLISIKTLDDLLMFIESNHQGMNISEKQEIICFLPKIVSLDLFSKDKLNEFLNQPSVLKIFDDISSSTDKLNPTDLVETLFIVLKLSSNKVISLTTSLLNSLLKSSGKLSVLQLHSVNQFLINILSSSTQNKSPNFSLIRRCQKEVSAGLTKRWAEVSNPTTLISLLYAYSDTSNPRRVTPFAETGSKPHLSAFQPIVDHRYVTRLEQRALELSEAMSVKELYRCLYLLARRRHRNTPLLRALAYHLNRLQLRDVRHSGGVVRSTLSPQHLVNLAYSCSVLNLYDDSLLNLLSKEVAEAASVKHSQTNFSHLSAISLLRSFSSLRWANTETLDALVAFIMPHLTVDDIKQSTMPSETFSHQDSHESHSDVDLDSSEGIANQVMPSSSIGVVSHFISMYMSLSNLGYLPPVLRTHQNQLNSLVVSEGSPTEVLNYAWCCSITCSLSPDVAAVVLSESFYNPLLTGINSFNERQSISLKLANINSAALLELPGYDGPTIDEHFIKSADLKITRSPRHLCHSVVKTLQNVASPDKYMLLNQLSSDGHLIDIELVVNKEGTPQLFYEQDKEKELSQNHFRIAMKTLDFSDTLLSSDSPRGLHQLAHRHLKLKGYRVVEIYHSVYNKCINEITRIDYVKKRILAAINSPSQS